MSGDEFEIVPKKDIEELKNDVEGIKRDPLGSAPTGRNLSGSMEKLTQSMDNMFELFKVANKEIKEEASSLEFMKQIAPLFENLNKKMERVLEQHDKIADGIVAIADLVKQMKEENEKRAKRESIIAKEKTVEHTTPKESTSAPLTSSQGSPEIRTALTPPAFGQPTPMSGRPPIMPPG